MSEEVIQKSMNEQAGNVIVGVDYENKVQEAAKVNLINKVDELNARKDKKIP